MNGPSPSASLILHPVVLSLISFGGIPAVLPDLHAFTVNAHHWLTDREFANCFAIVQVLPGPNMILMMGLLGWKVRGLPTAIASAVAIFVPSSTVCFIAFKLSERFRDTTWQRIVRLGLAPVSIGLVIAGGYVVGFHGNPEWAGESVTVAAVASMLSTRISPLWLLAAGGALGGIGLL